MEASLLGALFGLRAGVGAWGLRARVSDRWRARVSCVALGERVCRVTKEKSSFKGEKKDGKLETLSANTRLGLMAAHWCQGR